MQVFQVFTAIRLYPARLFVAPEVVVFFSVYKVRVRRGPCTHKGSVCASTRVDHSNPIERAPCSRTHAQIPMVLLRVYAMFYNILYYVPFVRNKRLLKKRIQAADKVTMDNLLYVARPTLRSDPSPSQYAFGPAPGPTRLSNPPCARALLPFLKRPVLNWVCTWHALN